MTTENEADDRERLLAGQPTDHRRAKRAPPAQRHAAPRPSTKTLHHHRPIIQPTKCKQSRTKATYTRPPSFLMFVSFCLFFPNERKQRKRKYRRQPRPAVLAGGLRHIRPRGSVDEFVATVTPFRWSSGATLGRTAFSGYWSLRLRVSDCARRE